MIGCGMAGLSLLDGALDVNGGIRQDGQNASDRRLTAHTVSMMTVSLSSTFGSHRCRWRT